MLVTDLDGGLGNMIWMLASTYALSKKTNIPIALKDIPLPPAKHSSIDYSKNIFKPFVRYIKSVNIVNKIPTMPVKDTLNNICSLKDNGDILLTGYLQHIDFIKDYQTEIRNLFHTNMNVIHKYDDIEDATFLQVRRGDYLTQPLHNVDLSTYYKRCTDKLSSSLLYVVSNDLNWCKSWAFLDDFRLRYIDDNDVDTLSVIYRKRWHIRKFVIWLVGSLPQYRTTTFNDSRSMVYSIYAF